MRLAEQAAEVKSRFGTLQSDRAGLRQLRVDWARQPQPIEVRLHHIRAVRNKLPSGRYGKRAQRACALRSPLLTCPFPRTRFQCSF